MLDFLWPWAFALVVLPLLMRLLPPASESLGAAIRAPFSARWQRLQGEGQVSASVSTFRVLGLFLAWICIVTAIARPQWVGEPIELPNTGRDLMLSLDLSGSMQIRDMQVGNRTISRVEAVKAIASDFTERRVGDRVGLILFGSKAYVQAPLTFDTTTVTQFIREAQLGFAGEDTAIGDALGLAIKRLRDRPAASRVLILLTDGQDTACSVEPMEAAALAAQQNVKVYTIGISRNLGTTSARGGEVDEALLRAIAEATGGEYFRARDPRELQAIYGIIDQPYIGERFSGGWGKAQSTGPLGEVSIRAKSTKLLKDAVIFTTFPEVGTPSDASAFRRVAEKCRLTRYGMDCYAYALLAAGQIDLVIEAGLYAYDIQGPIAVIEGAGGIVTDWSGQPAHNGGRAIAAANADIHKQAMELLQEL